MVHLRYDTTPLRGSREHYFHFLHGYLLPGLNLCLKAGLRHAHFEDCGPLMTPKLLEACRLLRIEPGQPAPSAPQPRHSMDIRLVPRWDGALLRFDKPKLSSWKIWTYKRRIRRLRMLLLDAARRACARTGSLSVWEDTEILVIRRSPDHPFYRAGGGASMPRYGEGRRSLLNTAEIAEHLGKRGRVAREVDVGSLTLCDQIMAFHHASAVVGARGAEFGNLVWMREGSQALMFATPAKIENNGTRSLAEIFDIRFASPKVERHFFRVDPKTVDAYLG